MQTAEIHLMYRQIYKLANPEGHKASRAKYWKKHSQSNRVTYRIYAELMALAFPDEHLSKIRERHRKRKYGAFNKIAEMTHVLHKEIKCLENQKR